jgi:hypothetical protein
MIDKPLEYKKFEHFRITQLIQQEFDIYKTLVGQIKTYFEEYQNMCVRKFDFEEEIDPADLFLLTEVLDTLYEYRKQHSIKPYYRCTLNLHHGEFNLTWKEK